MEEEETSKKTDSRTDGFKTGFVERFGLNRRIVHVV
jgi:hypothetical protein